MSIYQTGIQGLTKNYSSNFCSTLELTDNGISKLVSFVKNFEQRVDSWGGAAISVKFATLGSLMIYSLSVSDKINLTKGRLPFEIKFCTTFSMYGRLSNM